jgi:hypothetical protein
MSFEDRSISLNDDDDNIRRASDIKIRDVSWFNANYGPHFTFVKDLLTKKSFQTEKDFRNIVNENIFNFLACHASIAVVETMELFDQWQQTAINFDNCLKEMYLIKELKQLFENFENEGKTWPNGFETYVNGIRNPENNNQNKSIKPIVKEVANNTKFKALTDNGEKKSIAFGYRLRQAYEKVRTEVNKHLLTHWVDTLPSGVGPMSLMISILHTAYWEDCNRRAKQALQKANQRGSKVFSSSAAVSSTNNNNIDDDNDLDDVDSIAANTVSDDAIIARTNEDYKTFVIGKWYPSSWLTFLLYSKPGGRNGKPQFSGGIATNNSDSPTTNTRALRAKASRRLTDIYDDDDESTHVRKTSKTSTLNKMVITHAISKKTPSKIHTSHFLYL